MTSPTTSPTNSPATNPAGSLWTVDAMRAAMNARAEGPLPVAISGLSIDTRTVGLGEAFFAIQGDARDGHDFVEAALQAGAGLAVVAADRRDRLPKDLPLLIVADVLEALTALARAARARSAAKFIGVTGSAGKTGTKEALRLALSREGETHVSVASYNNHWGVPLSLARCPQSAKFAVLEMGMNHAGEIEPLSRLVRPHVAVITNVEPVHLEFFGTLEAIADAKAEIFAGVEPGGVVVLNRDNSQFGRLNQSAKAAGVSRIVTFGEHAEADARLMKTVLRSDGSSVQACILDHDVTYKIAAPGRHVVMNSLAVLTAAMLAGADLAMMAMALADFKPVDGRGARVMLSVPGGAALLIDESYNANPASMRAALSVLGQAPVGLHGRRIAVLGDMLELGPTGAALHAALSESLDAQAIDLVFCAGPLMRSLFEALPSGRRGGYAETSAALEPLVLSAIRAGDAVMIKGSLGSRMGPIAKALQKHYPQQAAADEPVEG